MKCPKCGERVSRKNIDKHMKIHKKINWKDIALATFLITIVIVSITVIYLYIEKGDEYEEGTPTIHEDNEEIIYNSPNGFKIHGTFYQGESTSPLIVLIHGMNEDRHAWGELPRHLNDMGYNVLTIDLSGHGESIYKNGMRITWMEFEEDDFKMYPGDIGNGIDYVFARYETKMEVCIIGASIGANAALKYASEHTDKVKSLILLSPGKNYRGITTEDVIERCKNIAILFACSHDDSQSYLCIQTLYDSYNGDKDILVVDGAAHGTGLINDEFIEKIDDWLGETFPL